MIDAAGTTIDDVIIRSATAKPAEPLKQLCLFELRGRMEAWKLGIPGPALAVFED